MCVFRHTHAYIYIMNNSYTYIITGDVANDRTLLMSVKIGDKENNYEILVGL